ncbi:MAG: glycosyltransferase, partial [Mycobacteriales bacterium]
DEVVFPAGWAPDEPVAALLEAARLLPGTRFAVTGTPPAGLVLPPNVRATGQLPREQFLALLAGAPVVLALTTREHTMQRAAYEAVAAGRPVVASGTAALRGYLGDAACYADGTGPGIAGAVTRALADLPRLEAEATVVRDEHERAFARALAAVGEALA